MNIPANIFGSPDASFSATKRLGSDQSRLSQIQDGKWKVVSAYFGPTTAATMKAADTVATKR
jgi:branched-chain amino acid transport system substrate-binding protein